MPDKVCKLTVCSVRGFVYPDETIRQLERVVPTEDQRDIVREPIRRHRPERDDDVLRILCPILDIVRDNGHVPEVKSSVNLVHEVKRGGLCRVRTVPEPTTHECYLVDMKSKDQGKEAERLLASRRIRNVLPALLRRHYTKDDALRERIHTVDQLQLRITPKRNHLGQLASVRHAKSANNPSVHLLQL